MAGGGIPQVSSGNASSGPQPTNLPSGMTGPQFGFTRPSVPQGSSANTSSGPEPTSLPFGMTRPQPAMPYPFLGGGFNSYGGGMGTPNMFTQQILQQAQNPFNPMTAQNTRFNAVPRGAASLASSQGVPQMRAMLMGLRGFR